LAQQVVPVRKDENGGQSPRSVVEAGWTSDGALAQIAVQDSK
jgi:hypothetical protein